MAHNTSLVRLNGIKTLRYALARLNDPHDVKECKAHQSMRQPSLAIIPNYTSLKEHCVEPLEVVYFTSQIEIEVASIDTFAEQRGIDKVNFIKFNIEGASKTLQKNRPKLAISIYYSYNDLYQIALFLSETLEDYSYRLGQYHYDLGETVLYAFPKEM